MELSSNAKKILKVLQSCYRKRDVTVSDIAVLAKIPITEVTEGIINQVLQKQNLVYKVPVELTLEDGMKKMTYFIRLTEEGANYEV